MSDTEWHVWDVDESRESATKVIGSDTEDHKGVAIRWAQYCKDETTSVWVYVARSDETEPLEFKLRAVWVRHWNVTESREDGAK